MNKETTKQQTGSEKLPDTGKAAQPGPDYFRVTVTGSRIPAGSVGYRVPSALYDGTKQKSWRKSSGKQMRRKQKRQKRGKGCEGS